MKKFIALFISAAMVVCLMPAMAFADEAPAAEPEEIVQDVTPTEEAAPAEETAPAEEAAPVDETAPAEEATLAEEIAPAKEDSAKLDARNEVDIAWSGWTLNVNELPGHSDIGTWKLYVNDETVAYTFKKGANDLSKIVDSFAKQSVMVFVVIETDVDLSITKTAYFFKANVKVDKASDKDTIFVYAMDKFVTYNDSDKECFKIVDIQDTSKELGISIITNTVVLKAGETSAEGMISFVEDDAYYNQSLNGTTEAAAIVIRELSNDGGYTVDPAVYLFCPLATWMLGGEGYAKFEDLDALQEALDEYNEEGVGGFINFVESFTTKDMIFTHELEATAVAETVVKKGVQTGDNNELGLWLAIGALASAACAAFALKRRED